MCRSEPFKNPESLVKLLEELKQSWHFACALNSQAFGFALLHEPYHGCGIQFRKGIWICFKRPEKQQGIYRILVSTPYMEWGDTLWANCLDQGGKIMSNDTPEAIIKCYPERFRSGNHQKMSVLLRDLTEAKILAKSCFAFLGEFHSLTFKEIHR